MRCFITGASGQLGSGLLHALTERGHELTALVLPDDPLADDAFRGVDITRIVGDVRDPASFPAVHFDWVFHLAADQSFWRGHAARQRAVNVDGVRNLVTWAERTRPLRLVHVSSLAAIGITSDPRSPLGEDAPFSHREARLMYFETKHAGEQIVRSAAEAGLPAVVVNPGTVLGPWDRTGHGWRLLGSMLQGPLRGVAGGGTNIVDVRDVAVGMISAVEHGQVGERYLLTGANVTYRRLAELACAAAGVEPPRLTFPGPVLQILAAVLDPVGRVFRWQPPVTPDDVSVGRGHLYFDNTKARRALGFAPRPLTQTVAAAIKWYAEIGVWASPPIGKSTSI